MRSERHRQAVDKALKVAIEATTTKKLTEEGKAALDALRATLDR